MTRRARRTAPRRKGGFGNHERWFPNIVELLETLDDDALRPCVMEAPIAQARAGS